MTVQEINAKIQQQAKEEKYEQMVKIQMKFIEEEMKHGGNSVIWCFSDRKYYHNRLERTWFEEFQSRARRAFESKGFVVSGITIKW